MLIKMGFLGDLSGWTQNNTTERHMKVKRTDYPCRSWRREARHGTACSGHIGRTPGERPHRQNNQAGGKPGGNATHGQMPLVGSGGVH